MSSDEDQKDKLKRLMQEGGQKGQEIFKKSSEFGQFGHQMADMANAGQEVLEYVIPSRVDLQPKIDAWQFLNQQGDDILQRFTSISMPTASTAGTASAYAMTDFARPDTVINFVEYDKQNGVRIAAQRLSAVIDRQADKDHVLSLMRQYDLSRAPAGQKSPEELFQTAWAAFERPVSLGSPASTSLIPMRECINATVATLLRRRPKQEQTKRTEKVLSIGKQIAHSTIPWSNIQSLQNRHDSIVDNLSAAKQKDFARDAWGDLLRRATLFLRELLETLDRAKMR
jgi:hypothetical protein